MSRSAQGDFGLTGAAQIEPSWKVATHPTRRTLRLPHSGTSGLLGCAACDKSLYLLGGASHML